jgi:hypothetical protein
MVIHGYLPSTKEAGEDLELQTSQFSETLSQNSSNSNKNRWGKGIGAKKFLKNF